MKKKEYDKVGRKREGRDRMKILDNKSEKVKRQGVYPFLKYEKRDQENDDNSQKNKTSLRDRTTSSKKLSLANSVVKNFSEIKKVVDDIKSYSRRIIFPRTWKDYNENTMFLV
ncbi:hypothetical protein C1646_764374 [Rhizophagus diaphanus]|nr:hypothetical protein C1646_764374 [Rhizophagus diaphanus] [Rhizophagus sp. MUCL 43196]